MEFFFASGDAPFYFPETIASLGWFPRVFDGSAGFGISRLPILWIAYPIELITKLFYSIGISWFVTEKILWITAFALAFSGAYALSKYLFRERVSAITSAVIYGVNTYSLLLFGGGQIGVLLAYGFLPFVIRNSLGIFDRIFSSKNNQELRANNQELILSSFYFGLLGILDVRVLLMALGLITLFVTLASIRRIRVIGYIHMIFRTVLFPALVSIPLHLYWIIPYVKYQKMFSPVGNEFTDVGMLKFLSFTDFSHALSLLHPNWPENLFGRVYFLQPEFLILPIVAFLSLVFIHQKQTINSRLMINDERLMKASALNNSGSLIINHKSFVQFFALLALISAFLAKGVNEPFGSIYQWMFDRIPGFILFRDSTKFYIPIALSYAILIPYTLSKLARWINDKGLRIKDKNQSLIMYLLSLIFIVFWFITLRPLFMGQLSGNFKPIVIPNDYVLFKQILVNDLSFGRTLWLPRKENISFASDMHPSLSSTDLWKESSPAGIAKIVRDESMSRFLSDEKISYIVIPPDIEKRIFLSDYKYDPTEKDVLVRGISSLGWGKVDGFSDLIVFRNPTPIPDSMRPVSPSVFASSFGVFMSLAYATVLFILMKKIQR